MIKFFYVFLFLLIEGICQAQENDPFMQKAYDELHNSPVQEKFRHLCPMPAGVVYIQQPGEGEEEIRRHFQTIKKLGFNCLKQIMPLPGWTEQQIALIALEEGLIPWWYGEGGWEDITPALLKNLELPVNMSVSEARENKKVIRYENELLKKRILLEAEFVDSTGNSLLRGKSKAFDPQMGGNGFDLTREGKKLFVAWVKAHYVDIEDLNKAYNQNIAGLSVHDGRGFANWQDFEDNWEKLSGKEYRHLHDILRFKADHGLEGIRVLCDRFHEFEPDAVFRGGGELSLFYPETWWGVDLEGIADIMKDFGSFYPSIHFAWHFELTDYELTRPFYMQASLAHDFFKGGWSATWESSGGPQQFSGGKGGAGFTVDEGTITQFLLSNLAAGFRGFGIWCWNSRSAGWEAGEFALLDRNGQVSQRAVAAGNIARSMNTYRDELWETHKEPVVGVFRDWDNEAIWSAMTVIGRDTFKYQPLKARIGISRALINANVPFEYVTASDLRNGLARRYQVIYLPAELAIARDLQEILLDYVTAGGKLVMDLPSWWFNDYGLLISTGKGSLFEKLFGTRLNDFEYSGFNRQDSIGEIPLKGFTADLSPQNAEILFNYRNGKPAGTLFHCGKGKAVLLGWEASGMCFRPGNREAEKVLIETVLGDIHLPYSCKDAIVYKLSSPAADHFFLINDQNTDIMAVLKTDKLYKKAFDVLTGKKLDPGSPWLVKANNGLWVRMEQ